MATFKTQIESLTKINTTGDEDKITQWLKDGVREIVNRITTISPGEIVKFTDSTISDKNNDLVDTGKIISVMRNQLDGSTNKLRRAGIIDPNNRYDATDVNSLYYRSAINPGYYILNGKINVLPASTSCKYD